MTNDKQNQKSILVVEDDEDLRELMALFFENEGLEVEWATSAEEALELIHNRSLPKLIITDLTLPKMSGDELMVHINSHPDREKCHVIVASGWDDLDERSKAIGANGCITKPFGLNQLRDVLKLLKS